MKVFNEISREKREEGWPLASVSAKENVYLLVACNMWKHETYSKAAWRKAKDWAKKSWLSRQSIKRQAKKKMKKKPARVGEIWYIEASVKWKRLWRSGNEKLLAKKKTIWKKKKKMKKCIPASWKKLAYDENL